MTIAIARKKVGHVDKTRYLAVVCGAVLSFTAVTAAGSLRDVQLPRGNDNVNGPAITIEKTDERLQGALPAQLPVERVERFEIVLNLKTARAIGLTIPQSVQWRPRGGVDVSVAVNLNGLSRGGALSRLMCDVWRYGLYRLRPNKHAGLNQTRGRSARRDQFDHHPESTRATAATLATYRPIARDFSAKIKCDQYTFAASPTGPSITSGANIVGLVA